VRSHRDASISRELLTTRIRRLLLLPTAALGLTAGSARYYFTHPRRVKADLPADLAAIGREVTLEALDGARLHAFWLDAGHDRTIVHHHGFGSCGGILLARRLAPLTAWPLVRAALTRGFNVLLVDARCHGRSGGKWDSKGNLAAADLAGWARRLRREERQSAVGLWGNSFGAVVGLILSLWEDHGGLDAMVLDSAAVSAKGLFAGVVHRPMYWAMQPVIHDLANDKLIHLLEARETDIPILLIHGMLDSHVPVWHAQEAYSKMWSPDRPELVELWLAPYADHLEAMEVAETSYIDRTLGWFEPWLRTQADKTT
jgi:pimeloyl-ACP methyl ester carboxylesterase